MKKFLFLVILVTVLFSKAYAVPAYPGPIKYTQPDGSVITVQLKGDERVHWAESSDGYTLLSNGKNGWEYAVADQSGDIKASGILAREVSKRTLQELQFLKGLSKNIRFSSKQVNLLKSVWEAKNNSDELIGTGQFYKQNPTTTNDGRKKVFTPKGTKKLIMILIEYTDVKFTKTRQDFVDLMNTQDYNMNGAQGCVRQYFSEMSYNQFNVTTDVAPNKYTADYDMAYYGAPNGTAHDIRANDLMKEAVDKADPDVDFSQYDNDGDGSVDGVYIIYAGYGEASSDDPNTIWPHAGSISGKSYDGKIISKYSCSNELNEDGSLTGIGVICHEFGHVCGAPDYYDTDYATGGQFPGTGKWDLMCGGCYNGTTTNSGNVPSHFNVFEKIRAGWISPIMLSGSTTVSIPDITTNPTAYIYNTTTDDEYYILENRQKTGFNSYVNGHGLLIYRYSKTYWDAHANKTYPEGFYLVSANITTNPTATTSDPAAYGTVNSSSCPFPGTLNKMSFTDATIPSTQSWAGNNTGYPLTNIQENSGVITFRFNSIDDPTVNSPMNFRAVAVSASQIDLSWIKNFAGNDVIVVANSTNATETLTAGITYNVGGVLPNGGTVIYKGSATEFSHSGLATSSTHYYQIWSVDASLNYSAVFPVNATTLINSVSTFPLIEGFNTSTIPANWSQVYNVGKVNWQYLTTGSINTTKPATAHTGSYFAWFGYNSASSYTSKLISPPLDLSGTSNPVLKFWYNQYPRTGYNADVLRVFYRTSVTSEWIPLATYNDTPSNWTLKSITLPNPSATYYIAFEGTSNTGYGVCVDDIEVWKADPNVWTGVTSNNWFTSTNWSNGAIPTLATNVEIPSGTPYSPTIAAAGAVCNNLTIDAGATLAMSSTAYAFTVTGNWINNGIFTPGAGTVSFQGTEVLQTISGSATTNFNILEVKTGSIGNVLEATSMISFPTSPTTNPLVLTSGTFKLSSASTINFSTNEFDIYGGLWNNGGSINSTSNNVVVFGQFKNTAGTSNIQRLYYSGSTISVDGGAVNISAQIRPITAGTSTTAFSQTGGTLTFSVGVTSGTAAPFELTSGSSFAMSGGTIIIQKTSSSNSNDYYNLAGTSNVTGGTLQIGNANTTGSPVIRVNSTAPIFNLVVSATGTPTAKLITNPLTVKGDITIGSGAKIDANSLNLSVGGNWINNGGTLTATPTGTVTFNGTTSQNITGSASSIFNNLTIDNTSGVAANSNLTTVGGALLINSGKVLNIAPAKALTVNGTFTNDAGNNGFVLQSDDSGTATFLDNGSTNSAVPATVQQYLPSVRNWYMSSPVYGATAPAGNTYYKYIEAANNGTTWTPVSSGSDFDLMTGYIVKPGAATTFAFSGALNTGVKQITGLTSTATAKTGFNLVGNPYPSYVNWMSATKTNLSTTIWYRTQNSAKTPAYVFDTYNETANTGTNNNGVAAVTEMIPPMQAFWVKVNAGTTGSLAFDNNMRSHQDVTTNKFRSPAANATQQVLRLQVSNGANSDEAIVLFNTNATDGFDAYDSQKMTNGNASIPEIYTLAGTEKVVINGLNSIATNETIPLGFTTGSTNSFSIKATQASNFDADTKIVLIDNVLQAEQDISDGTPYYFTSDIASTDNRFSIVFRSKFSTTDIDNSAGKETILVSKNANNQIVVTCKRNDQAGVVMVSNAIGQKLYSATITGITTVITKSFNPGIYLVTVNEADKLVTKKVIIN